MLSISGLSKSYGSKKAVSGLSLEVRDGELCAFIGHNGAGKTTALKAIAGILPFDEGTIEIDGHSIADDSIGAKSIIAYIPDEPDLFQYMTGRAYLSFIADIFQVGERERKEKAGMYSALFGMENDLDSLISSYSHGMRQKLAVISGLIHSPRLILMDEPFVGLDPIATHTLKEIMRDFCRDGGSILFSTHVLEVAEKLCSRVAIIRRGELAAYGSMDEVRGSSSLEDVFLELENGED
ncbi:MAG: ABC transporter ATP-binding protein [Candidatus Ornithospirochaeta sp.]|nr:ABC transporter ATP-binding protein [Candidatus Ornithospirochaeta sp.]